MVLFRTPPARFFAPICAGAILPETRFEIRLECGLFPLCQVDLRFQGFELSARILPTADSRGWAGEIRGDALSLLRDQT